jgi:UDP-N-acetylmuramate--alanine ligase
MSAPISRLRVFAEEGGVHFMGIGGAGMRALAELLARQGVQVTGCDTRPMSDAADLGAVGIRVAEGHDPAHIEDAAALVVTSAVPSDHPELVRARKLGVPVLKRAEALGDWVADGTLVGIAGTHGKTTTTAIAGLDPTGLVGGKVRGWDGNLRPGSEALYVVEADEYDRSFHTLRPDVAVVTNVEADHLDIYGDLEGVREGFREYLRGLESGGRVIACADDPGASSLLPEFASSATTYGTVPGAMLRAVDVRFEERRTVCTVWEAGNNRGTLSLGIPGRHNLLNALAATAAARHLGADWTCVKRALADFRGVGRRFDVLGEVRGVVVVDDYAHHPTEVAATLEGARAAYGDRRIVVAFQPHLYSRTRDFAGAFGEVLAEADLVWVTDVFPAREAAIPGVTGALVAEHARNAGGAEVRYHGVLDTLADELVSELRSGDVLITMGAGSIEALGPRVLGRMGEVVHA